ncbi:MAG: response regulator, partial [Deltaproteobacteria bacterium]|nr:response regulator [Deltaproteobacteria bacterium]
VVAADGGLEGVRLAAEHAGALRAVLLDLTMPDLAGDAVFARIRQAQPDLPVVLMSGYGEAEVMARFAGARVSGFLHKPFDSARLMETLGRV